MYPQNYLWKACHLQRTYVPPVAKKNGKTKSETHAFLMIFGRTDLIIGQSKAKFCEESAGDVRFCVAPQKPGKSVEKRVFETKKIADFFVVVG